MDYRYFFMKSSDYYAELSKMSAMLANAILKNNCEPKMFNVTSDGFLHTGITNYKYLIIIKEVYINLKAKVTNNKLIAYLK